MGYFDIFLRISGKIFRRFYVIFVSRPNFSQFETVFVFIFTADSREKVELTCKLLYCLKQWQEHITLVMGS